MVFKASLIVFSATAIGHFVNYLYHLVNARFLSPAQFGLLGSFVALNYFLAVLISAFALSVINYLNRLKPHQLSSALAGLQRLAIKISLGSWLIFTLFYPLFKSLLHLTHPSAYFIFSLPLLFVFIPNLYSSALRAKLKFASFSFIGLVAPFIRTLAAFILLSFGLQIIGAISAMTIASLAAAFTSILITQHRLKLNLKAKPLKIPSYFWQFSLLTLITHLSLTSLYSSDILLARYYLPSIQAGLYSAVSILGRIIFFASATVYIVAFPIFNQTHNQTQLKRSFLQSFFLVALVAFSGLLIYQLQPQLVIKLLFNPAYLPAIPFLPAFALFMTLYSLFHLTILFLLSRQHRSAAWLVTLTALGQICLILFRHSDLNIIINNSIISVSLGLLFSLTFAIKILYAKNS